MNELLMPPRKPGDGPINVSLADYGYVAVEVTSDGELERIFMSEYNAWRVFGALSLILGIPLSKNVAKAIKMDTGPGPTKMVIG